MIQDLENAKQECLDVLKELLEKGVLQEREKEMIYLRFFSQTELVPYREIGEHFSVSQNRISDIFFNLSRAIRFSPYSVSLPVFKKYELLLPKGRKKRAMSRWLPSHIN